VNPIIRVKPAKPKTFVVADVPPGDFFRLADTDEPNVFLRVGSRPPVAPRASENGMLYGRSQWYKAKDITAGGNVVSLYGSRPVVPLRLAEATFEEVP